MEIIMIIGAALMRLTLSWYFAPWENESYEVQRKGVAICVGTMAVIGFIAVLGAVFHI